MIEFSTSSVATSAASVARWPTSHRRQVVRTNTRANRELTVCANSSTSVHRRAGGSLSAASAVARSGCTGTKRDIALSARVARRSGRCATSRIGTPGQSPTRIHADENAVSDPVETIRRSSIMTISARGWSIANFTRPLRNAR
jgi:hypothetical protein